MKYTGLFYLWSNQMNFETYIFKNKGRELTSNVKFSYCILKGEDIKHSNLLFETRSNSI